jgi:hypothetical protein
MNATIARVMVAVRRSSGERDGAVPPFEAETVAALRAVLAEGGPKPAPRHLIDQQIANVAAAYRMYVRPQRRPRNQTPDGLRQQLESVASAIERALDLAQHLPSNRLPPGEPSTEERARFDALMLSGYGLTRLDGVLMDGTPWSLSTWLNAGAELAHALRSGAQDIDVSKTRPTIKALNQQVGAAIFICTGDVAYATVRRVLEVLEHIEPARDSASGSTIEAIQEATASVHVGPGAGGPARIGDLAPSLRRSP